MKKTTLLIMMTAIMACTGCYASHHKSVRKLLRTLPTATYGNMISDSIVSILLDAKDITCTRFTDAGDSLRPDTTLTLSRDAESVLIFLLADERNFQTDLTVFGKFVPWVSYKVKGRHGRTLTVELDFGLKKWRLLDAQGHQACQADMTATNLQLLRFTRLLLPKDANMKLLYDTLKNMKPTTPKE